MAYVLQQFRVADYDTFERVFLEDGARRRRLGSTGGRVFHRVGDEREITVLLAWESAAKAREFADSYELQEAVKWATSDVVPQSIVVLEQRLETEA